MNNKLEKAITTRLEAEIVEAQARVDALRSTDDSISNLGAISLREGVVYGMQLALQTVQIESLKITS